ncbi:hypothetical protein SASPL_120822 [Salvia splendens]|uniref:Uncharacterized protein n=1 Tax=Salvia splendens TaxID=180675 RepID=A0A8X8ZVM8_SALSN|nr:hypothetical protein SASPL_120822 [Salvia splendens]
MEGEEGADLARFLQWATTLGISDSPNSTGTSSACLGLSMRPRFTNVESSSIYGQPHFTNRDSSYVPPRQYKTSTIRQPTYSSDVPPRNLPEMDRLKLFDSDGISSDDDLSKIEINQEFAKNKKREELHSYEALKKQGRVDSSASDSEESSSGEEELKKPSKKTDANFFEVLIKVKNQDPILREQDAKLFESDDEDSDEEEDTASMKKGKPMYLKDVVSKQLIKAGPELSDEEDGSGDGGENNKLKSYSHEQTELRKQIGRISCFDDERFLISSDRKLATALGKFNILSPTQVLCVALLNEMNKGRSSWWYPYLKQLPRSYDLLASFTQFEIEALQIDDAIWTAEKAVHKAKMEWKEATPVLSELNIKPQLTTFNAWLWASSTLSILLSSNL